MFIKCVQAIREEWLCSLPYYARVGCDMSLNLAMCRTGCVSSVCVGDFVMIG
jgi:hypothetical protein